MPYRVSGAHDVVCRVEAVDEPHVVALLEDVGFPSLGSSAYERAVLYHLVRRTLVVERHEVTITLPKLAEGAGVSVTTAREVLRSLQDKGVVDLDVTRRGYHVAMLPFADWFPAESEADAARLDLESVDFSDRRFIEALLDREEQRCFYCLRNIDAASADLDHVVPQHEGDVDRSFRNMVASCFACNTEKGATPATDFLRVLYRTARLSAEELADRSAAIERLHGGDLAPDLDLVERLHRK